MKKIIIAVLIGGLFSTGALAQRIVPMIFTIAATALIQNGNQTVKGVNVTVPAPIKNSVTTSFLLSSLALDEQSEGNYPFSTFPSGSKIVFLNHPDDFTAGYFVVEDKSGNFLVDISDILTFTQLGNQVQTGTENESNGLLTNWQQTYLGTLYFDDTGAGGSTQMYMGGLLVTKANDVANTKAGTYKETSSASVTSAVGTGFFQGQIAVITGTASVSGSATFSLP